MKPTYKDSQLSVRINGELLQEMKADAAALNLSMADFVAKLYNDSKSKSAVDARLEALERAVFHQSQAA